MINVLSTDHQKRRKGFVDNPALILFAFITAFCPRILDTLGIPSAVNFVHFLIVPSACISVILNSRSRNRRQLSISWKLLTGLFLLFLVIVASALLNNAGLPNLF